MYKLALITNLISVLVNAYLENFGLALFSTLVVGVLIMFGPEQESHDT